MRDISPMQHFLRFASLVAAVMLAASAPAHAQPTSEPATKPAEAPARKPAKIPQIIFFVAKGEPDACGAGCREWIAAHGGFDEGAPIRLGELLATLDKAKRKLPIYFFSPGGSVRIAMEIGRLMRARKMKAGVGRTIPQGCDPRQVRDKACEATMRSGAVLTAELRTGGAACNSACVYAVLGAAERDIAPDAALGVHSGRLFSSTPIAGEEERLLRANATIARYLEEMGIARGVVEAAAAVPSDKIRYLKREEIVQFGIDKRELVESRWTRAVDKGGRPGLQKYFVSASNDEPKQYRTALLRLTCSPLSWQHLVVQLMQERPSLEKISIAVVTGTNEAALDPVGKRPSGETGLEWQLRSGVSMVPPLQEAAKGGSIEIVEKVEGAPTTSARRIILSAAGLGPLLGPFSDECR
jgi:hypothetical protein